MIRHRICEVCGNRFTATRIDAGACSDSCQSKKRRDRDALPVRIRAAKNALSALVEVAAHEDEAWWTATLGELHTHIATEAARIAEEVEVP